MIGTKAFIQRCRVLYAQENSVIESKKTPRLCLEHACARLTSLEDFAEAPALSG